MKKKKNELRKKKLKYYNSIGLKFYKYLYFYARNY